MYAKVKSKKCMDPDSLHDMRPPCNFKVTSIHWYFVIYGRLTNGVQSEVWTVESSRSS